MDIESFLFETEPFRSVLSPIVLPLPVSRDRGPQALEQQIEKIRHFLEKDLYCYDLKDFDILVHDISKAGYPGGETPVTTLCVYVNEDCHVSFGRIRDALHRTLILHDLQNLPIEVVSLCQWTALSKFVISPNDPAINLYKSTREALADLVFGALGDRCLMLGLFRVGPYEERSVPVILCIVKPRTQSNWSQLVTDVHQLIDPALKFQLLPGHYGDLMDASNGGSDGISFDDRLDKECTPEMGFSIGRMGDSGAGTLGGFASLRIGNNCHHGFLTCHHVVAPLNASKEVDCRGFRYIDAAHRKPEIGYLAPEDVQETEGCLKVCRQQALDALESIRSRVLAGMRDTPKAKANQEEILDSCNQKLARISQMPLSLGRVLLSSGKTVCSRESSNRARILDWAFVEIREYQAKENTEFRNVMPKVPWSLSNEYQVKIVKGEDRPLSGLKGMEPGQWYFKQGRTTAITTGLCNGLEVYVSQSGTRYDLDGNLVEPRPGYTEEWVILGKKRSTEGTTEVPFCEPGDSGATIINSSGEVCGILYGEITGLCGRNMYVRAGLVTCMTDVVSSMGDIAGQPITLEV
jgi:hypothetical protein